MRPAVAAREARGARRRRETRSRLLVAALKLMAEKGMEGAAINEITEAADVGFGSFYNHFESKEAIYAALLNWVFKDFADAMDRVLGEISDPAEVIAAWSRRRPTLRRSVVLSGTRNFIPTRDAAIAVHAAQIGKSHHLVLPRCILPISRELHAARRQPIYQSRKRLGRVAQFPRGAFPKGPPCDTADGW